MLLRYGLGLLAAMLVLTSSVVYSQEDSLVAEMPYTSEADLASIQLSSDFTPSTEFNGYINLKGGASVVMTMIHNVTSKSMSEAWEQSPSRVLIEMSEFKSNAGYDVVAYKETAQLENAKIVQYTVFIGNGNEVLWLSIAYHEKFDDYFEPKMIEAIRTVNLNARK